MVAQIGTRDNILNIQGFSPIKQRIVVKKSLITKTWLEYLVFQTRCFDTLSRKITEDERIVMISLLMFQPLCFV